jgi:hypothetical protein
MTDPVTGKYDAMLKTVEEEIGAIDLKLADLNRQKRDKLKYKRDTENERREALRLHLGTTLDTQGLLDDPDGVLAALLGTLGAGVSPTQIREHLRDMLQPTPRGGSKGRRERDMEDEGAAPLEQAVQAAS